MLNSLNSLPILFCRRLISLVDILSFEQILEAEEILIKAAKVAIVCSH